MTAPAGRRADARTIRTQRALAEALVDLLRTRDFDAITVQQLLDRAGVGRATFYAHYRNKDDFLLSDFERMLELLDRRFEATERGRRVAPLAELFAHVREAREFQRALARSGRMEVLSDILAGHLARTIERRLRALGVEPAPDARALPLPVTARVLGAAAVELLTWWLDRDATLSAAELDARFHELVWRGVTGAS